MKKRMLAMLLAAVMVVMSLPVFALPVAAASGWQTGEVHGTYGYIKSGAEYYPLNNSADFDIAFGYGKSVYDIVLLADYTANNLILDAKKVRIYLNGHTLTVTGDVEVDVDCGRSAQDETIFVIDGDGGNISFPNNTSTSAFTFGWNGNQGLYIIVTVENVTFSNCKGRILNADTTEQLYLELTNARFENCSADKGSCLYVNSDKIEVRANGCQFVNCSATDGGAVYVDDINAKGFVMFSNTYAVNCHAFGDGGFLYINDADAVVWGCGTTVIASCSAGDDGGAIYTPKASVVEGFLLSDNRAEDDGGAIFNESTWAAVSTISNCRFYRNSCGGDGGAVYIDDDNGTIKDCKFFENDCSGDGYELYSNDVDTLLTNCTFTSGYSAESAVDGVTPSNCSFPDKSSYSLSTGDGSQANPYVIRNIDDWDAFHYMVLNHAYMEDSSGSRMEVGTDAFKGKFVRLDADILVCNTIGERKDILGYTAKYEFTGTFDGNGHTVTCVIYDNDNGEKSVFGNANGATVRNLTVNGYIKGTWSIGGIFGYAENCTAENCVNNATLKSTESYVGGIAGYSTHSNYIRCTNNGEVEGSQEIGGIVGHSSDDSFNICVNNGSVLGLQKCGGIVGYMEGRTATIKNFINRGTVTGIQYVGGFIGAVKNSTSLGLYNSVNDAAVSGNSNISATVSVFSDHSSVANCYFNSDLCATATYAVPFSSDVMHGISADEYGRFMPHTLNYGVDHDFQSNGWLHAAFNDDGLLEFVPDGVAFYMGVDGLIHATDAATRVTGSMETLGVAGESHTYYVDGTVTTTGRVQILGDVTLVLNDGCNYYVQGGIGLEKGNSLTVCSYSLGEHMGSLTAAANQKGAAAIGGNAPNTQERVNDFSLYVSSEKHDCGDLTIYGGNIEAVAYSSGDAYGVGIGGSSLSLLHSYSQVITSTIHESDAESYCGGDGGNIAVYNGNLSVKASGAVGIGGGNGTKYYATYNAVVMTNEAYGGGAGGTFAYYGGTVTVESNIAAFGKGRNGGGERDDVLGSDMTAFTFTDDAVHSVAVGDSLENLKEVYALDEEPNLNGEKCIKIDDWRQTSTETLDPTCETAGHKAYVLRTADNLYYEDTVFTKRIGDASALQVWKAEGGAGYIPPLGHVWEYDDENYHKCLRCEKTESHTTGDDGCTKCNEFYYDYSAQTQSLEKKKLPSGMVVFPDFGENYTLPGGWYLVHGDIAVPSRITCTGDVHLVLENGCNFTASQGITLGAGVSLSVYAQSLNANEMGKLTAVAPWDEYAGIGSDKYGSCGNISIYGGGIAVKGGCYAAGIGSSYQGSCGDISVYGGVVTVKGGGYSAGIGSSYHGSCGDIFVYGGDITANGGSHGAGIGIGGGESSCGDITIYDGSITAIGGEHTAGIGSSLGTVTIFDYLNITAGEDEDSAKPVTVYNGEKFVQVTKLIGEVKAPTCTKAGHIEFYKNGDTYYSDKECTEEITNLILWLTTPVENGGGMIPPTGHRWIEAEQTEDGTSTLKTAATCDENAVYYKICSGCGLISTAETWEKPFSATGHHCEYELSYDSTAGVYIVVEKCKDCEYSASRTYTPYDYIEVDRGTYIDTGYKPNKDTRVVMNVYVNSATEYWFGAWDVDYNQSAFALGNDDKGIYAGYGNQGGTNNLGALSNGLHTVEMNKNEVYFDGVHYTGITHQYSAEGFPLQHTLYLFAQNRNGSAVILENQNTVYCYGCEIYDGDTLVHKFVPAKGSFGGLLDVVTGVFYGNIHMTARNDTVQNIDKEDATCTEHGHNAYYMRGFKWYSDANCANEITDIDAWLATAVENGGGMIPALGHDWQYIDEDTHQCRRCKSTEAHTGADTDYICDVCNGVLLDTAKEDAILELNSAAGENPSLEVEMALDNAIEAVSDATTIDEIMAAKINGLNEIVALLTAESDARALEAGKIAAKAELTKAAGDNPSHDMAALLDEAKEEIDSADDMDDLESLKEKWLNRIEAQLVMESLASAKAEAINELTKAAGENPSNEVTQILNEAIMEIDAAGDMEELSNLKDEFIYRIKTKRATEALAAAKAEAIAAFNTAANGNASSDMTAILNDAKAAVNEATTLEAVAAAKADGLAAISAYLDALSEAKTTAKTAVAAVVGEHPSATVQASVDAACGMIDDAETPESVMAIQTAVIPVIMAQIEAEAAQTAKTLEDAKDAAKTALEAAIGDKPSDEVLMVYAEALHDVDTAATITAVQKAEEAGFAAIMAQLAAEAAEKAAAEQQATAKALEDAKDAAKEALQAMAGENPSDELAAILSNAFDTVDEAETMADVMAAEEEGFAAITAQLQAEAEAAKQAVEEELAQAKRDLATATAALNAANNAIEALDKTVASKEATIAEKQAALNTATEQLNAAKEALETAQANIEELEGTVAEKDEALSKAAKDLEDKQAALDEMTENYNETKAALDTAQKDLADTTKALDEAKAANEQLQKDLAAANESIAELNNTIKSKDATIAEKQAALDTATEQLNAAKADLDKAKANLETAQANIEELEGTVSEQDEALKKAMQDLKDAQDALNEMTENYNTASAALDDAKKALEEAKAANEKAKNDLAEANAALKTANDAIAALNEAIANKDATMAEKLAAVEAAQKALDDAKAKVTELEGTVSEQDETLTQAEQDMKALQAEIERLKALLDDDPTDPQPAETLGDANGDGAVNMKDVLLMRKYLAGLDVEYNAQNADCNGDGEVNMKDVLMLRKYLANIIDKLGA